MSEGGSTTTPAANRVTFYAKADGLLYSKDDAGTEKLLSSGPATGVSAGTTNPVGPASGDLFWRTDLGYLIYYNGTRWLTVEEFVAHVDATTALMPITADGHSIYYGMHGVDRDIWLVKWFVWNTVLTTNNATNYWTVTLKDVAGTSIATYNTSADTAGVKANHEAAIGALLGTTSPDDLGMQVDPAKTLTPGGIYIISTVTYRLVVT